VESRDEPVSAGEKPLSAATRKIYADDWQAFRAWCAAQDALTLPAPPTTVAAYLAARRNDLGASGLRVILAAIAFHHRDAGLPWSSTDPAITAVLRDNGEAADRPVRPAVALTQADIERLVASCDHDAGDRTAFPNLRDRALLLIGFAAGLRRSELVALDREDLDFTTAGLALRLRAPGRGAGGDAETIYVSRGTQAGLCAVQAMEFWLRRARIDYGPVFPRLTTAGTIEARLTGNGVWKIFRRRAALAGLDVPEGARLSPQGIRTGFIAESLANGEGPNARGRAGDVNTARRYRQRLKARAGDAAPVLDR
jgi:integrase